MTPFFIAMASLEADANGHYYAAVRVSRYDKENSIGADFGGFRVDDPTEIYKKHVNADIAYQVRLSPAPEELPSHVSCALVAAFDLGEQITDFALKAEERQLSPAAFKTFMRKYLSELEGIAIRYDNDSKRRVLRGRGRASFLKAIKQFNARKAAELKGLERAHITRTLRDMHNQNVLVATMPRAILEQQAATQGKTIADFEREQMGKAFSSGDGGAVYALLCAMDLLNDIFREARGDRKDFPYDQFISIGANEEPPEAPEEYLDKKGYVYLIDTPPTRDFMYSVYEETVFNRLGLPTTGRKGQALLKYIDTQIRNIRDGEKSAAISLFNFKSSNDPTPTPNETQKGKRRYAKRGKTLWQFWRVSPSLYAEGLRFNGINRLDFSHYARSVYAAIIDRGFQHATAGQIARAAFYIDNRMWAQIDHIRALSPAERELQCPDGIARISGRAGDLPLPARRPDREKYIDALKSALAEGAGIEYDEGKSGGNVWRYQASKVIDRIANSEPEIVTPGT